MRILLLSQFFPPVIGGEERHVRALGQELASRGHEVHVATVAVPGTTVGAAVEDGLRVHRLPTLTSRIPALYSEHARPHLPPFPDPVLTRALSALTVEHRFDIAHAHNWIVNSWIAAPAGRKVPLVLTLHDYSDRCSTKRLMLDGAQCTGPSPGKCLAHAVAHYGRVKGPITVAAVAGAAPLRHRAVDRYLVVSQAVADGNGLDAAGVPYEVVPNFVPDAVLEGGGRPRPAFVPEGDYLFFAGDLMAEKGLHVLWEAYAQLGPAAPALVCAGRLAPDTPSHRPPGVTVVQDVPHADVLGAFEHAVAAVAPSVGPDACPTTVLEAMATGTPVVTTATGGMVDMVVDGESGLLVPPGDVLALAAALQRLLNDADLRARVTAAASARVRERFSVSRVVDRVEAVYGALLR